MHLEIRELDASEFAIVWPIFQAVVSSGETYSYAPDTSFERARELWSGARIFVAMLDGEAAGCYLLRANQPGLGDHVANAGYMVAPQARGRGIAHRLCEHSLETALAAGFRAMQFNFVVASNEVAVRLWQKHGFRIVGRIPEAFRHVRLGLVDALVMHRYL